MGFNYALEKLKFDKEWEKLHDEYSAAGMSEAAIAQMKTFDWDGFAADGSTVSITSLCRKNTALTRIEHPHYFAALLRSL